MTPITYTGEAPPDSVFVAEFELDSDFTVPDSPGYLLLTIEAGKARLWMVKSLPDSFWDET